MRKISTSPAAISYYRADTPVRYKLFAWHEYAVELEYNLWDAWGPPCKNIKITLHYGGKYIAGIIESPAYLWPCLRIMRKKLDLTHPNHIAMIK